MGFCLACAITFIRAANAFCHYCKAPKPLDWTTGNRSLDLFIMESWKNTENGYDADIQWVECSLLTNVQQMKLLRHGCTHIADWLDPIINEWTKVTLKQIGDTQSFDFHQVNYLTCK